MQNEGECDNMSFFFFLTPAREQLVHLVLVAQLRVVCPCILQLDGDLFSVDD